MTNYTINVGSVTDYNTPQSQTYYSKVGITRYVIFTYITELVTINVSASRNADVTGKVVSINNNSYTLDSTGIIQKKIPYNTSYTISVSNWTDYITPQSISFTASQLTRIVNFKYVEYKLGVNILDTDGALTSYNNWNSENNNNVIGIAVITTSTNFIISTDYPGDKQLNTDDTQDCSGATKPSDELTHYDGYNDTQIILKNYTSSNDLAANVCNNYIFKNGRNGYLPSTGEYNISYQNMTAINNCLSACGGSQISNGEYWTSTYLGPHSSYIAFYTYKTNDGTTDFWQPIRRYGVRIFCKF